MTRVLKSSLCLLLIFLLSSCDSGRVYEVNKDFADKYWHKDSIQRIEFNIPDASRNYSLFLNLRNASTYPFQNIYIQFELEDSTNTVMESDLMDFQLFHQQTGRPFGSSGIGDIFDHQLLLLRNYQFPSTGKYSLEFKQMMRMDSLIDILSVGARVEFFQEAN